MREKFADVFFVNSFIFFHDVFKLLCRKFVIHLNLRFFLGLINLMLEVLMVAAHYYVAEHINKAAINVISESRIASPFDNAFDDRVVQAEIQHRVHHTRHRNSRAASHRNQQRAVRVAEFGAHRLFKLGDIRIDLLSQSGGPFATLLVIVITDLGGDSKARRNRNLEIGHLSQIRSLAAKCLFHLRVTFGLAAAEEIHILLRHLRILL